MCAQSPIASAQTGDYYTLAKGASGIFTPKCEYSAKNNATA